MDKTIRENQYDLLRILSMIAVIVIHVNWSYLEPVFLSPNNSVEWAVLALMNILPRFCVPAFLMMSGAFLLENEKNGNAAAFYKRSIKKIFVPTVVTILILGIIQLLTSLLNHRGVVPVIKGILFGDFYALWYMYMLLGLYFLVPYLIRLKTNLSENLYTLLAVVLMLWAIVSQATSAQILAYSNGVCFSFLSYFLLGDVLKRKIDQGYRPKKIYLILICIVCAAISYFWRFMGHNYYISSAYTAFFSPSIVIYSLCVFVFFGTMNIRKDLSRLSGLTFEMYLVHSFVIQMISPVIQKMISVALLAEAIIVILTIVISAILAMGLRILCKVITKNRKFTSLISGSKIWDLLS